MHCQCDMHKCFHANSIPDKFYQDEPADEHADHGWWGGRWDPDTRAREHAGGIPPERHHHHSQFNAFVVGVLPWSSRGCHQLRPAEIPRHRRSGVRGGIRCLAHSHHLPAPYLATLPSDHQGNVTSLSSNIPTPIPGLYSDSQTYYHTLLLVSTTPVCLQQALKE